MDLLLAGTILSDGDQLRVNAELVQAPTGTLVASYVCQTRRDSIFEIQDSLVHKIVEVLMLQLTERERRTLSHDVPGSAKAYEFFLRANYLQRERTVENLVLVRDLYRVCVEEDPNYAPAWARLGRCYRFLEKFGEAGPAEPGTCARCVSPGVCTQSRPGHRAQPVHADRSGPGRRPASRIAAPGASQSVSERSRPLRRPGSVVPFLWTSGRIGRRSPSCPAAGLASGDQRGSHAFLEGDDYEQALASDHAAAGYYLDAAILALTSRESEAAGLLARRHSSGVRAGWMRALIEIPGALLEGDRARCVELAAKALAQPSKDPGC